MPAALGTAPVAPADPAIIAAVLATALPPPLTAAPASAAAGAGGTAAVQPDPGALPAAVPPTAAESQTQNTPQFPQKLAAGAALPVRDSSASPAMADAAQALAPPLAAILPVAATGPDPRHVAFPTAVPMAGLPGVAAALPLTATMPDARPVASPANATGGPAIPMASLAGVAAAMPVTPTLPDTRPAASPAKAPVPGGLAVRMAGLPGVAAGAGAGSTMAAATGNAAPAGAGRAPVPAAAPANAPIPGIAPVAATVRPGLAVAGVAPPGGGNGLLDGAAASAPNAAPGGTPGAALGVAVDAGPDGEEGVATQPTALVTAVPAGAPVTVQAGGQAGWGSDTAPPPARGRLASEAGPVETADAAAPGGSPGATLPVAASPPEIHSTATAQAAVQPAGRSPAPAEQIAPAVLAAAHSGDAGRRVSVSLSPGELGQVNVTVERGTNGALHIQVSADQLTTLDMLRRDQSDLMAALDQSGARSGSHTLSFSWDGGTQGWSAPGGQRDDRPPQTASWAYAEDAAAPAATASTARSSGGIDVTA